MLNEIYEISQQFEIITVPGLHGSGVNHWQTAWEKKYGFSRVEQDNWDRPEFEIWENSLYRFLKNNTGHKPVIIVAHSLGCHLIVKSFSWIKDFINGVFLVAPPNLDSGIINVDLASFSMPTLVNLEVLGCLVYSENDPYADVAFSEKYGDALGLEKVNVGKMGHINSDSHLGDWEEGILCLQRLLISIRSFESVNIAARQSR